MAIFFCSLQQGRTPSDLAHPCGHLNLARWLKVSVHSLHAEHTLDISYLPFPYLEMLATSGAASRARPGWKNGNCVRWTLSKCGLPCPVSARDVWWKVRKLQTAEWFHTCTGYDLLHRGFTSPLPNVNGGPEWAIQTLTLIVRRSVKHP